MTWILRPVFGASDAQVPGPAPAVAQFPAGQQPCVEAFQELGVDFACDYHAEGGFDVRRTN